jgi:hypothetical protein
MNKYGSIALGVLYGPEGLGAVLCAGNAVPQLGHLRAVKRFYTGKGVLSLKRPSCTVLVRATEPN